MQESHPPPSRDGKNLRIHLTILLAVCGLAAGGGLIAYHILVKAPADLAEGIARGFKEMFNFTPEVRVDQTIVIEQNVPILEVATVSRDLFLAHGWSHTWLGSTKTLEIQGVFTAKGGFDLHEPFRVVISKNPLRVVAQLPPPRILSIQMNSYRIIRDEDGWWNEITAADRQQAIRDLQTLAKEKAETSGLLEEVRNSAEARIREMVQRNGAEVEFRYPAIPPPPQPLD